MKYYIKDAHAHIKRCKLATHSDPNAFFRACLLAVASIKIHSKTFWLSYINPVYDMLEHGMSINEIDKEIPFIRMQFKRDALNYLYDNKENLWNAMLNVRYDQFHDHLYKTVPGLGSIKAGFMVQMCYGKLGCVDSVNLKRFGIDRTSSVPHIYRKQLKELGESSERMWWAWCNAVAERGNKIRDKLSWSAYGLSEAHSLFVERGSFDPKIIAKNEI